jgi:TolB protein
MRSLSYSFAAFFIALSCTAKQSDSVREEGYFIAYNTFEPDSIAKDNWEIHLLSLDSAPASKNLTKHPDVAWTYLAHRDKIYFISDRDTAYRNFFLYEMSAEGTAVKKLSGLRLEDSWMDLDPKTNEMVVSARPTPTIRYQLFLIDLDDGSFKPLISDSLHHFQDPVFSPDGLQIAFVKSPKAKVEGIFPEVFLINRDGSGERQLTHFPAEDPAALSHGYKAGALKWHPTENFISYASSRGDHTFIFAVSPDGSNGRQLSNSGKDEVYHDWSPDGKWLVFDQFQDTITNQYHIVLMNWESKERRILTDTLIRTQLAPVFLTK